MKSAKVKKMERKAKHKALAVAKTVKSRQRRLDNKAKHDEIHAIDPDMKVRVIDQVTYNEHDIEIMVENGKIKAVEIFEPEVEEFNKGRAIDDQIEKERLFGFKALTNRFKKK